MQQGPQGAQETPQVSEQLLGLQPDHDDQHAVYHFGRSVGGAVKAVPAASLRVAARVTVAVPKVVRTVPVVSESTQYGEGPCLLIWLKK